MNKRNRWEELFGELLDLIEFRLIKYPDGWGLVDRQGANLGDIESDRFDSSVTLIDRLEVYVRDYIVSDIEEDCDCGEYHDWSELLEFAKETMAPEDLERYHFDLEILDMICNHPSEVNLENCFFDREER